jgi:D-methionine transport system substrate-binding protein
VKIPTAPIAIYSHAKSLDEVRAGTTVALPNDPTNQARALVMLDQLGWIRLPGIDPIKASEKDIAANLKSIKLLPLEAAQLPRSLQDADYAFVNGNFALASGLKLRDALRTRNDLAELRQPGGGAHGRPRQALRARYRRRLPLARIPGLDRTALFAGYAKTDYQLACWRSQRNDPQQ